MAERRPKGTGSLRKRGSGYQATYTYRDAKGKQRRRSRQFDSHKEAQEWLNTSQSSHTVDPGTTTLADFLTSWLGSMGVTKLEAATQSWYRSAVERHIIPEIGSVKLSAVTTVMLEAFLAEKAVSGRLDGKPGGLGPASLRRLHITLHKALDKAVRDQLLDRNPADFVDAPEIPKTDATESVWTPQDIAQWIEATRGDRHAALWRLLPMTGLRRSEACALKWSDIDLNDARLSVRRAAVIVDGRLVVKGPKTEASRRTVDLDPTTVSLLREWRTRQLEDRLRAGTAWKSGDWVFTDEIGAPVNPDSTSRRFDALVADADLPKIKLRQLRHSHATALLSAGVHPKVVQERLGHSSIKVTLDIYSAVLPNMQRHAVERLSEMFG